MHYTDFFNAVVALTICVGDLERERNEVSKLTVQRVFSIQRMKEEKKK